MAFINNNYGKITVEKQVNLQLTQQGQATDSHITKDDKKQMEYSKIFDLTSIHQHYWKDFCDVCYSRFGFEQGEMRTYEQKYETFCRCKNIVTEEHGYEQQLMDLHAEDLERLKAYADYFFGLRDARDIVPALYYFVRQIWSIEENIRKDIPLIKYICPRKRDGDYSEFKIEFMQISESIKNNKTLRDVMNHHIEAMMLREIMREDAYDNLTFDPTDSEHIDSTIEWILDFELRGHINTFNSSLQDFIDALPDGCECARGSELQAFLYRLFMSYEESLTDIKEHLEEYPTPRNLKELRVERDHLIEEFEDTRLGEHWMECIEDENGLQLIANHFMHKRKRISEEEEHSFFYTLDKICIITDILNGKAEKYWLDVDYPEGWNADKSNYPLEQNHEAEPSRPNPIAEAIREQTEAMKQTAEAMKEIASRPTTQNLVYPQEGSTTNVGCDQKQSEFKTLLPTGNPTLQMEKKEEKGCWNETRMKEYE